MQPSALKHLPFDTALRGPNLAIGIVPWCEAWPAAKLHSHCGRWECYRPKTLVKFLVNTFDLKEDATST